jgi:hypothetical protein
MPLALGFTRCADWIKKKRSQALIWGNVRSAIMNSAALVQSLAVNRQHTPGAICQVSFDMIFRQDEFKKFERESVTCARALWHERPVPQDGWRDDWLSTA